MGGHGQLISKTKYLIKKDNQYYEDIKLASSYLNSANHHLNTAKDDLRKSNIDNALVSLTQASAKLAPYVS